MLNSTRPLTMFAGSKEICRANRIRVQGRSNMTLLPDFFTVEVYNLSEEDRAQVMLAGNVTVIGLDRSVVCYGEVQDVYTKPAGANEITVISISDGQSLWEATTDASFGSGAYIKGIVESILGEGHLACFMAENKRLVRGQTFSGKVADIVSFMAKSVDARAFVTHGAVLIVEKGRADNYLDIPEDEVVSDPAYATGICILKTVVKGYAVGTIVTFRGRQYRVVAQAFDADNDSGLWQTEVVLVDESELDEDGMEGG